jgi:flagellar biosynthesis protein FliR
MNIQAALQELGTELGIKVNLTVLILTMALLMSRILPVIILTPFLGGEVVPTEVKLGLGLTLGMVLFPGLVDRLELVPTSALPYVALLMKELFIGLCLSFIVGMIFQAAQVAGTLIDTMAGTNMAQVQVPQLGQQVSLFSSLKLQLTVVLFLTLNGHHFVIQAFADSLVSIPLDQFPRFSHGAWPFFDLTMRVFGDMMRIALAISAPVFLSAFLTDLALGMINRVAPQVQVFFIAMQIKPMVTVLMVFVALHLILLRVSDEFVNMFKLVKEALLLLT